MFIFGRFFYIQAVWGKDLQQKAIDQWSRELPVIAERGLITDRNGIVLVGNENTYSIFLRPRAVTDKARAAEVISSVLNLDRDYVAQKLKKSVSEITLKKQVPKAVTEELAAYDLSGVYFSRDNTRVYPYGSMLSRVLGWTNTDGGASGIELYYDKYLSGCNGEILTETDLIGREIEGGGDTYISAIDGLSVKLTIDFYVQNIVEDAVASCYETHSPKSVSCIVLEPSSGEILALAQYPTLDLNELPRDDITALNTLSRNGIVADIYEPGSTFKIFTVAANIEENLLGNNRAIPLDHVYSSDRYRVVDGSKIKCWSDHKNGKHANQTIVEALENSCNPVFVDIALALGKETMYKYLELFGFNSATGVDFVGEAQGMLLPVSLVKNADLARIGFGQTIAVTPIQLAAATAAAVNGGYYFEPHLVKEIYSDELGTAQIISPIMKNRTISEKASRLLASYLEEVVSVGGGRNAYIEGYRVAGKTGTAQKYKDGVIDVGKYVSSFVGFFPADDPKYLALFIVDEPSGQYYGSTVAAPYGKSIFEKIIKTYNM